MKSVLRSCLLTAVCLAAGVGTSPHLAAQELDAPPPIEGINTVFMEEMTWMEVRDAIAGGTTTVVVAPPLDGMISHLLARRAITQGCRARHKFRNRLEALIHSGAAIDPKL